MRRQQGHYWYVGPAAFFFFVMCHSGWGQTYAPPEGGWSYIFHGQADANGETGGPDGFFKSLDGTWDHNNGSDSWDGSRIGEGLPGGVSALSEGGTDFIRIQDTGDPRDALGIADPSNRKVYLTHRLAADFTDDNRPDNLDTILDDGMTIYFRLRIATADTGPLDQVHPDGGTADDIADWPERGMGYYQHDSGKSLIGIKESGPNGANIAFGFAYGNDIPSGLYVDDDGNEQSGLILPHLLANNAVGNMSDVANVPADLVQHNIYTVDDPTEWQEFWLTIQAGTADEITGFPDGTHLINVFSAGAVDPLAGTLFGINAANGTDYGGDGTATSYLAIGTGATPRVGAFDLDFIAYAPGIHLPSLAPLGPSADFNGDGKVDLGDFNILKTNFGGSGDSTKGDANGDSVVNLEDFNILKNQFGQPAETAVPEPSSAILALLAMVGALAARRRS